MAVSPDNRKGTWIGGKRNGRRTVPYRKIYRGGFTLSQGCLPQIRLLERGSTSYNGGQGRITNELRNQQVDDALDLWLVEETTRYYYRMLAIKQIFENPTQYGFVIQPEHLYKPMEFKKVEVTSSIPDLVAFAKQHQVSYAQLKDFNSWLRDTKLTNTSGKTYTILIPTEESLYYQKGEVPKVHNQAWVVE